MAVIKETATVYRGGGRRWFTEEAAVKAEAIAVIKRKWPSERRDPHCGGGFHWRDLPRSDVLLRRMCRLVRTSGVLVDDGPFTTDDTQELARRVRAGETLQWEGPGGEWLTPRDRETMLRILREDPTRTYRLLPAGVTVDRHQTFCTDTPTDESKAKD